MINENKIQKLLNLTNDLIIKLDLDKMKFQNPKNDIQSFKEVPH